MYEEPISISVTITRNIKKAYYYYYYFPDYHYYFQSPTPRPHVTTSVRPRPQRADMCKICTSLQQPYNVGNIFSDNIHVYWSCVRSIYMVVK